MPQVFYRRRLDNAGRKAGNLADFCTNWGHHYDFMVVLDADSLMSGDTIRRMIRLMEDNERIGLIQTVSHPVNRETLFARIHQFAANLYTPLSVLGLNFWSQEDANYWGHNAIVRIKAFMAHCDLPVLPGKAPLGGEILCHDVVEACLMRRGPWEVRLLPELGGTWEELPGNTIDYAGRDKRWCQGNLQHMRFLPAHGLRWPGRMHILMGIMCYLSAPIWFAFLVLSAGQLILGEERGGYGLLTSGLFNPGAAAGAMFALTLTLLFLPKVLSIAAVMADGKARRSFGGGPGLAGERPAGTGVLDAPGPRPDGLVLALRRLHPGGADRRLGRPAARRPQRRLGRGVPVPRRPRDPGAGDGGGGAAGRPRAVLVDVADHPRPRAQPRPDELVEQAERRASGTPPAPVPDPGGNRRRNRSFARWPHARPRPSWPAPLRARLCRRAA